MTSATNHFHEDKRLRALERLGPMNAPAGAFADSVVRAAASIASTPIGAVTIVRSERVQVRACCGLAVGEAPRSDAICSHAIFSPFPFIVPDARRDGRLLTNPFVIGPPYIRFYAGFPLIVDEQSIGVLCVADDRPRVLTDEQHARLATLAKGAAAWLCWEAQASRGEALP